MALAIGPPCGIAGLTSRPDENRRPRLLVVAHDFPPVRSPQAVRSLQLASALAARWDITLVTRTAVPQEDNVLPFRVVRVSPGFFEAAIDRLSQRARGSHRAPEAQPGATPSRDAHGAPSLNWKGKIVQRMRRVVASLVFPDPSRLWLPHAQAAIQRMHAEAPFDVALVMHEPPSALGLATALDQWALPWVADLADPVLAPYTARWWRKAAFRLEARTLKAAREVTATNDATLALLRERHPGIPFSGTAVRQGFTAAKAVAPARAEGALKLLYTGRFYTFRRPEALLDAVVATPGVTLTIAGPEMPAAVLEMAARHPDRIILAGDLPHEAARLLQMEADVLVCVANAATVQVPGKFFEYLGAGRVILHLTASAGDELEALLLELRRGEAVANEPAQISAMLSTLVARKREPGGLSSQYDLSEDSVRAYSWSASADILDGVLRRAGAMSSL